MFYGEIETILGDLKLYKPSVYIQAVLITCDIAFSDMKYLCWYANMGKCMR